ncbi:MAG: putative polyketide biosynthesis zinc-dependent hydrolase BaeB [bacterium ADurb.Bin429]|nr:MAG: putative polyketide biosynthesis zinc-dependent hydrolase BaeB [bacterium ADurb.Bin429]
MLTIHAVPGAPLETNCYLVADENTGEAIIVDAPWQVTEEMMALADEAGVEVREIVCSHGHWDHSMGAASLSEAFGVPVAVHPLDADMLEHPSTAPFNLPLPLTPVTPARLLEEGDEVTVGTHVFTVLHTPGHTPGGICLYCAEESLLFSGDILFAGTYGRTDFPGGDPARMVHSLLRLRALPPETRVYPGHGPDTTIGRETWLARAETMEE